MQHAYHTLSTVFFSGNKIKIFERRYKTLLAFLSDLGGIFDILMLLGGILYFSYNSYMLKKFLMKMIHGENLKEVEEKYSHFFDGLSKKEMHEIQENMVTESQSAVRLFKMLNTFEVM